MSFNANHIVDEGALHLTSVFSKTGDHAVLDHVGDQDEEVLVALGYKQEFKRFALGTHLSNISLTCAEISLSCPHSLYLSLCLDFFPQLHQPWATI